MNLAVMLCQPSLKLSDLPGQFFMLSDGLAQFNESPNNKYTHLNCDWRIYNTRSHYSTVLRKGIRQCFGKLELFEVVAICDHISINYWGPNDANIRCKWSAAEFASVLIRLVWCYHRFFLCFITVLISFPNSLSFCLFSKYDISL